MNSHGTVDSPGTESPRLMELVRRAHDEPDVQQRAKILNFDLRAAASQHRRLVVALWPTAVVAALTALLARLLPIVLTSVHADGDPWLGPYLGHVAEGIIAVVIALWIIGGLVRAWHNRLARAMSDRPTASLVIVTLTGSALLPAVGAALALFGPAEQGFLLGLVVGTPLAMVRLCYPVDTAKQLALNNPWTLLLLARQARLDVSDDLIDKRLRWLIVRLVTAVVGATATTALIVLAPVSAIPLAVADAGIGFGLVLSERARRAQVGRFLDVAVTAVIVVVAALLAARFIVSSFDIVGPTIPA